MAEHFVDIALELAVEFRRDRTTHDQQRVDGKEWVPVECHAVTLDKALQLQSLVFETVLDSRHLLGRRAIVGQLENTAKENRNVFEFGAGARFDLRNDLVRQISVRAAEVEVKFHFSHLTRPPDKGAHQVRRSKRRAAAGKVASKLARPKPDSSAGRARDSPTPRRRRAV